MKNYKKIKSDVYKDDKILMFKNKEMFKQHINDFSIESIRLTL